MELYILRHAIAVERGTAGFERDSERPLTPKGEKKMLAAAKGMLTLGLEFDLILTSPFVRARQTAELVAAVSDRESVLEICAALAADGDPADVVEELRRRTDLPDRVLLVGHEPMLSGLISTLLCGDDGLSITMKKGGLCCLHVTTLTHGRCATLEWLLAPRHLAALI
jgi:phosphohistidine phosphatase